MHVFSRTWILTLKPVLEPLELLEEECKKVGLGKDEFLVPALGEIVMFKPHSIPLFQNVQYKG